MSYCGCAKFLMTETERSGSHSGSVEKLVMQLKTAA